MTIGVVANVYNEANALPGWLESASKFADWIGVMDSGPAGRRSDDGTLDILQKWRIPVQSCSIDDGYGVVRTATIRMCPCDWVMLLDADERFDAFAQVLTCAGESTPRQEADDILYDYSNPNFAKDVPRFQVTQSYDKQIDFSVCPSNFENLKFLGAKLSVTCGEVYNQIAWVKQMIADNTALDAIKVVRRHWHDFSRKRPTQNWHHEPDYQMRFLRRRDSIFFAQDTRMHERIVGADCVHDPNFTHGPFFEHYHCHFKPQEVEQRGYDVAVYNAINEGKTPPTEAEFRARSN